MKEFTVRQSFKPPLIGWKSVPAFLIIAMILPANHLLGSAGEFLPASDPFGKDVRTTPPLAPQDEQKSFHLPPGFEIQLVASEPDIAKPINLAFDDKGRLWITESREYPFPAQLGKGRDKITILSDFGPDGKAKSITNFAEHLNIPVGLYPYQNGVIAYSIPEISFFDGRTVKPLYARFGYERDTHGMASNFQRGFDGWLYGCHGFNNISTVQGSDHNAITLNSGNTYRMKLDGSHIEYFTHGQTNPFGLCFDPLGNLYSSDSHSKPLYQLIRGGFYEGISKTHDGLGFAPRMMTHLHGSTAIAGILYYAAEQFPAPFRDNMFVGNVVTSRINRDSLLFHGSTPVAKEEPDFLSSDDPWFRPCNLTIGPDGAMYVADFYNRIIGHYEVPLDHPGRDRERGRIWRIVYTGTDAHAPLALPREDWSSATAFDLIADLGHPNLVVRMIATNELVDRLGAAAVKPLQNLMEANPTPLQFRHAMWALFRLGALDDSTLVTALRDPDAGVRVHAVRILGEMEKWDAVHPALALACLTDADPLVQRCAVDALGRHPDAQSLRPLLDFLRRAPAADTHLVYALRVALRELGSSPASPFSSLTNLSDSDIHELSEIAMAIPSPDAAVFLMNHIDKATSREQTTQYLRHAVEHLNGSQADALAEVVRKKFAGDVDFQLELLKSVQDGLTRSGSPLSPAVRAWALELTKESLKAKDASAPPWSNFPLPGATKSADPWVLQARPCSDGQVGAFLSSLPRGEHLTGILRSQTFVIPAKLSFFLAGHNGYPKTTPPPKNMVRLCLADTKEVVAQALPPRHDLAQPVNWSLDNCAGKKGYLEIVDGDEGRAYAWLAFGRLDPAVVPMPAYSPSDWQRRQQTAAETAENLHLMEVTPELSGWLKDTSANPDTRAAAALALASFGEESAIAPIAAIVQDSAEPLTIRQTCAVALGQFSSEAAHTAVIDSFRTAPAPLQMSLARTLAQSPAGSKALLQAITDGKAPARLLLEPSVKDRLWASGLPDLDSQIKKLTQGLAPPSEKIQKLLAQRRSTYLVAKTSPEAGAQVFAKNCTLCHQLEGQGKIIGPQLDGIGNRGLDRLIEDILDPSRNVDPAFRTSNVYLNNGQVITGLFRREEGQTQIFADSTGKEIAVPKDQIQRRFESKLSLMPENFADIIAPDDFNNLVAYLLSKRPLTR